MSSSSTKKHKRGRSQTKESVATAVAKVMNEEKKKIPAKFRDFQIEQEFVQVQLAGPTPYPEVTWATEHITQIPLGNASNARGNGAKKILLKGIQLRGQIRFYGGSDNPHVSGILSIVIVYDRDPVGSMADVLTNFLAANAGNNGKGNSWNVALNNDGFAQRFQVLRRMDFSVDTDTPVALIDTYIKGNKRPVTYRNAGTGEIGDIQSGAVYALVLQGSRYGWAAPTPTIAETAKVSFDCNMRVRFHEVQ